MKVILSRKGFDSGYGGMPSPILPDGRIISLPIPSPGERNTLADINFPYVDIGNLISQLSKGRLDSAESIHLDPDLDRRVTDRLDGWRPSLGQANAAQSHLANCGVGTGDVFLFFGWFREVEVFDSTWRFKKNAPDLHILFGWLEIDSVLSITTNYEESRIEFPWIENHPHVIHRNCWQANEPNTLYIARQKSSYTSLSEFGGGRFPKYHPNLQLTKVGRTRSVWSLPSWFSPNGRTPLTYHSKPSRWVLDNNQVILRSVAKGQEFVIDSEEYPDLENWVSTIIKESFE